MPADNRPARLAEALRQQQAGHDAQAFATYEALLVENPDDADALHLSALIAAGRGDDALAEERLRQAVGLAPDDPVVLANFGLLLSRLKQADAAVAALRRSLQLAPNQPEAAYNLGNVLRGLGRNAEAAQAFVRAIELRPAYARAMLNLAHLHEDEGRFNEAESWLRRALVADPTYLNALNNLGNLLRQTGRPYDAIAVLERALAQDPGFSRAWNNLGSALRETGRAAQAVAAYQRALERKTDYPEARMNLGMALLAQGNYTEGWHEFEYRWQAARELKGYVRDFAQPRWRGESLSGRTILLHAEQGLGDALQFFRYVPLVRDLGARVVVECQPELKRLFARTPGLAAVVGRGEALPPFDLHCPFMSLPLACGTTLATVPANVPYVVADPAEQQRWAAWLGARRKPRIGLVWAGNPRLHDPGSNLIDRRRSLRLAQLEPVLAHHPDFEFVSLQKETRDPLPPYLRDPSAQFGDFADTAALVAQLDLIIAVDTSVAHLAGALGRPVWLLSRFDACWRWLEDRQDSPWYPQMRLFRQQTYGDWNGVIAAVAAQLAAQ